MAVIAVEIVSKETIKPSTPTPEELKTLKLSILDHINPHVYARHAFFYTNTNPNPSSGVSNYCDLLKASLSKVLAKYYPFAGRIDKITINCNDEGVEFIEAKTEANLADVFLPKPAVLELHELAPFFPASDDVNNNDTKAALVIQVTRFACGGIVIGTWFSGKAGDPHCFVNFMNDWAALTAAGDPIHHRDPEFVGVSVLPLPSQMAYMPAPKPEKPHFPTRRLVFDVSKLKQLEPNIPAAADSIIIALLFKSIAAAMKSSSAAGSRKKCMIDYVVNLRGGLTNPPVSDHAAGSFGSHNFLAITEEEMQQGAGIRPILEKLKGAVAEIKDKYSKKDADDEWSTDMYRGFLKLIKLVLIERAEMFVFISSVGLPYYDVDFGWGSPAWVGSTPLPWKNCILLRNIKNNIKGGGGGGADENHIEAWISLEDEKVLETVASDEEILAYATINPTISLN
ncbi:hypothetical protein Dimus_015202 [Dionaea muscipula]